MVPVAVEMWKRECSGWGEMRNLGLCCGGGPGQLGGNCNVLRAVLAECRTSKLDG